MSSVIVEMFAYHISIEHSCFELVVMIKSFQRSFYFSFHMTLIHVDFLKLLATHVDVYQSLTSKTDVV